MRLIIIISPTSVFGVVLPFPMSLKKYRIEYEMGAATSSFGYETVDIREEMCYKSLRDNYGETYAERCEFNPNCKYLKEYDVCTIREVSPSKVKEKNTLRAYPQSDILYRGRLLF